MPQYKLKMSDKTISILWVEWHASEQRERVNKICSLTPLLLFTYIYNQPSPTGLYENHGTQISLSMTHRQSNSAALSWPFIREQKPSKCKFRPDTKATPLNTSLCDTVEQSSNLTLGEVTYSFPLFYLAWSEESVEKELTRMCFNTVAATIRKTCPWCTCRILSRCFIWRIY